jgi:hypothetical protein
VNSKESIIDNWTFGGGTAMMLQIDHRESHDIDIFLPDPQLLPFLDPQTHDFAFEIQPTDYKGDGAKSLKLAFENIGEIDFIVGGSLTSTPTKSWPLCVLSRHVVRRQLVGSRPATFQTAFAAKCNDV